MQNSKSYCYSKSPRKGVCIFRVRMCSYEQPDSASRPCSSALLEILFYSSTSANVVVLMVLSKLCFGRVRPCTTSVHEPIMAIMLPKGLLKLSEFLRDA